MPNSATFETKEEYNTWFRNYRAKNREKLRVYNREYNKKWRKKYGYHNEENSKNRYPEKQKAREALQRAVKSGKIPKLPCFVCKNPKSQAHHSDYTKPLTVLWLCALHHTTLHKSIK